jgi:hypothetical protein
VAWLGFGPQRVRDRARGERLARNALRYASSQPAAEVRPWPDGRQAAALLASGPEPAHAGLAVGDTGRAAPRLLDSDGVPRIELPQPSTLVAGLLDTTAALKHLLRDYERIERVGGLYSVALPDSDGRAELLELLKGELPQDRVWFARPEELASWWLRRARVEVALEQQGDHRVEVRLRNGGPTRARGVTVRVYLPPGAYTPKAGRGERFGARPRLRMAADRSWVDLIVADLAPRAAVAYLLSY